MPLLEWKLWSSNYVASIPVYTLPRGDGRNGLRNFQQIYLNESTNKLGNKGTKTGESNDRTNIEQMKELRESIDKRLK